MPEVSFYLLATASSLERYQFACKLIEKVYRSGVFPYVLTDNDALSQQIDDLLWTFRAGSFVPHQIHNGNLLVTTEVILIGTDNPPEPWQKTIINLSRQCPQDLQRSERILEILDDSEETKTWGRKRYRQYQQAGFEINTHTI